MMQINIRTFDVEDAEAVSRLIRKNLVEVNSRDYDGAVIDYMCRLFSPAYLRELTAGRVMFVAEVNGVVSGTVGLEGDEVCALYVAPDAHGQGIGERLMRHAEEVALERNIHVLHLSASLTAVGFYEKMGYVAREREESEYFGPAYIMTKLIEN